jgi:hypothetical protein
MVPLDFEKHNSGTYAFGAGLGTGLGFLVGLETPMLINTNPSPFRNDSRTLIFSAFQNCPAPAGFRVSIAPNHRKTPLRG